MLIAIIVLLVIIVLLLSGMAASLRQIVEFEKHAQEDFYGPTRGSKS